MDTRRILNLCALGGPIALAVTLIGWLIAGMLPLPKGPSLSSAEVVAFYTDDPNRVMIGFVTASIGVVFIAPLIALISMHMLHMEGRLPIMAFLQLATGAGTVLINMFPQMIFAIGGFRADRSPDSIVLLNDLGWLLLFTGITPFMLQNISIGIAILRDNGRVFPRWAAYLNFWVAFAFVPDVLAYFFKTGPFAWNGVLVFWLALTAYGVFLVAMSVLCWRANREATAGEQSPALTRTAPAAA